MARFPLHAVGFAACLLLTACVEPATLLLHNGVNDTAYALTRISNVLPTMYHLHFTPYLSNFTFDGLTTMLFDLRANSTEIVLNSVGLMIDEANVVLEFTDANNNGTVLNISSIETDVAYERIIIHSPADQEFKTGSYSLKMPYGGLLRNSTDPRGFFYGTYYNNESITYYGVTQFEPMHARKAFQCVDEPGYRTPVMVHINRNEDEIAISNMPRRKTTPNNVTGRIWDVFETTPEMATYLVAFFVGQFDNISTSDGFYSVYARPDAIDQGKYALSLMGPVINTLTDFFQVNYTFPKLDLVALPDFGGAMENWGMTTFREAYALFREGVSSEFYRDTILQIICHEFGHQWFGDLVTAQWWGDIWLNEGFATYLQHTIAALIEPSWRYEEAFSLRVVQVAFEADVDETHAMTYSAYASSDLKFDEISYEKAGSVLKMVEHTITLDVFKKGLTSYLLATNASGGVASPDLLFTALETQVQNSARDDFKGDFNFTTFIESWTHGEGFPLISVKVNNASAEVKQERFSSSGIAYNTSWYVPLTYTTEVQKDFTTLTPKGWIIPGQDYVQVSIPENSGWVIFNILQSGYYRVNYDTDNWNTLIAHLKQDLTQIPPVNRAQLIDDAFHLAEANYLDYSTLFSLVEYLRNETDYIPWQAAMKNFKRLIFSFQGTDLSEQLKVYVSELYSGYYNSVANSYSSDHVTKLGTIDALQFACDLGYAPCVNYTSQLYNMWLSSEIGFPPEKKTGALCTGLRRDSSQVLYVFNKFADSNVFNDKMEYLTALACTEEPFMLQSLMESAFLNGDQTTFRVQHKADFFSKIIEKPRNIEIVIEFVTTYYADIVKQCGQRTTTSMVSNLGSKLVLDSQITAVQAAVDNPDLPKQLRDTLNETLPKAKKRQAWVQTYTSSIYSILAQHTGYTSASSSVSRFPLINIVVILLAIYRFM